MSWSRDGQALRRVPVRVLGFSLPHPPAPSPCNGEGENGVDQVPSLRVERGLRGEVKPRSGEISAVLMPSVYLSTVRALWIEFRGVGLTEETRR